MLTPVFKLQQTDEQLIIEIYAPYANVKDAEADYADGQFYFSAKPYFLKLYLPCELDDATDISGTYSCDKGSFTFKALKKNVGEFFPNLDLINELLKPSEIHAKRLLEEIGEDGDDVDFGTDFIHEPQTSKNYSDDDLRDEKCRLYGYGFACSRHGVIGKISAEIGTLIDLENPEISVVEGRVEGCLRYDQLKFSAEHYIADMFEENPLLDECFQFKIPESCFELSFESRDHLKDLKDRKNFSNFPSGVEKAVALSLIDLLFAYLYDIRTTNAEHSSESGWTIAKLSPTLSYFVKWRTAKEALVGAVRRSLCYPLYRHYDLSMQVLKDLKLLFGKGKVALLQCLVDMRMILSTSGDYRYLLNDLYVTDYCLWIQRIPDGLLTWLCEELDTVLLNKNDIDLDLEEIELEAKLRILQVSEGNTEPEDSDDDVFR